MSSARETKARSEIILPFVRGLSTVVSAIERESLRRRAHPYVWWQFHERMVELLPRWRRIARGHHKRMARRYEAMVWATSRWAYDYCVTRAERAGASKA